MALHTDDSDQTTTATETPDPLTDDKGEIIPLFELDGCVISEKANMQNLNQALSRYLKKISLTNWLELDEEARVKMLVNHFNNALKAISASNANVMPIYHALKGPDAGVGKEISLGGQGEESLKAIGKNLSKRLDELLSDDNSEQRIAKLKDSKGTLADLYNFPHDYSPLRFVGCDEALKKLTPNQLIAPNLKSAEKDRLQEAVLRLIPVELEKISKSEKILFEEEIEWSGKEAALEMEILAFRKLSNASIVQNSQDIPPEVLVVLSFETVNKIKLENLTAEQLKIILTYHSDYFSLKLRVSPRMISSGFLQSPRHSLPSYLQAFTID